MKPKTKLPTEPKRTKEEEVNRLVAAAFEKEGATTSTTTNPEEEVMKDIMNNPSFFVPMKPKTKLPTEPKRTKEEEVNRLVAAAFEKEGATTSTTTNPEEEVMKDIMNNPSFFVPMKPKTELTTEPKLTEEEEVNHLVAAAFQKEGATTTK